MKQILLYFGEASPKAEKVCSILQAMQLSYRIVTNEETAQSVGYLLGLPGFSEQAEAGQAFPMDLMLLKDICDEEILAFNEQAKILACEMKQKAMLTSHNQHWKLADLLAEIQKEHRYFQYAEQIQTMLGESQHLIIEDYTQDSWKAYETAFYQAYDQLQKEGTLEEIQAAYEALAAAKQNLIKRNGRS